MGQFINYDGYDFPYSGEVDVTNSDELCNLKKNTFYFVKGYDVYLIYGGSLGKGKYPENNYFYLNNNEVECYYDDEDCLIEVDIEDDDEEVNKSDLFSKIQGLNTKKPKKKSNKTSTSNNKKKTSYKSNEIIHFDINEEDDDMVSLLKQKINDSSITMNDVYAHFDNNTEAYNLYYGLLNRNTITFKSLNKWCEIIDCEVEIALVKKK